MKKLFISIIITVFALVACATTPPENPICPKEGSWICERSQSLNTQPEEIYGWIYSATAIAAVTDVVSQKEICDFEGKIADWYNDAYPITYNSIISKVSKELGLIKDAQKAILISNILNKRLMLYSSSQIISKADDEILRKGHAQFREDMLCN